MSSIGRGGHARLHGGLGHGRRDLHDEAGVKMAWDDVVGAEAGAPGPRRRAPLRRSAPPGPGSAIALTHASFISSVMRVAPASRAPRKNEGEAQHVVDLVRVVRTAGGHDEVGPRRLGELGADLRVGVGQRQDQRCAAMVLTISGVSTLPARASPGTRPRPRSRRPGCGPWSLRAKRSLSASMFSRGPRR